MRFDEEQSARNRRNEGGSVKQSWYPFREKSHGALRERCAECLDWESNGGLTNREELSSRSAMS